MSSSFSQQAIRVQSLSRDSQQRQQFSNPEQQSSLAHPVLDPPFAALPYTSSSPPLLIPIESKPPAETPLARETATNSRPSCMGRLSYMAGLNDKLKNAWQGVKTPKGFLITIYFLNVIAWGGMLFLLLINASPAMCHPTCNDINSPRKKWIEIDSQILNALFCVPAFLLFPWRLRDLYFLLTWRLGCFGRGEGVEAFKMLAVIHQVWFRLPHKSADVETGEMISKPAGAASGVRAPATARWKMDVEVWSFFLNTVFQIILSVYMWKYNRFDRPQWAVGAFLGAGMLSSAIGGGIIVWEARKIRNIENPPARPDQQEQSEPLKPSTQDTS